ncbi:MAG: PAS domain S-box protein, partial [Pseudomonadota bacterium]
SRALLRGEVIHGEDVIIRRQSGEERWVSGHAAPVRNADGEIEAAVVVFADITERKAAEAALDRFRMMAQTSPDLIALTDPEGELLYLNATGRSLVGLGDEEPLTGRTLASLLAQRSVDDLHDFGFPTAIRKGVWQREAHIAAADGEEVPVSIALVAHCDSKQEIAYFSTTIRDLRRLRLLEGQLRQSQRLEAVGRLAGGVAHDVNNMLMVMDHYIDRVRRALAPDDPQQLPLAKAGEASARTAKLCTQLLSFARQQPTQPALIDLNEVVRSICDLLRRALGDGISMSHELAATPCYVLMDRSQCDQMLSNLAVNAGDAMGARGALTIETGHVRLGADDSPEVAAGDYVLLRVSVGIAPEDMPKIFDPYFSTKTGDGHSGLGLATVHGIVKQNGGQVRAYSDPGDTRFEILLPQATAPLS